MGWGGGRGAVTMALLFEDLAAWGWQVHQTRFLRGVLHTLSKQCSYTVYEYNTRLLVSAQMCGFAPSIIATCD